VRDIELTERMIATYIEVVHIGLHGLPWIPGLETGSGKDAATDPKLREHPYVKQWIATVGVKKCELNAMVRNVAGSGAMVREMIGRYIPEDWPEVHAERLHPHREEAMAALRRRMARRRAIDGR
jgi:hypothetical protein